ncbi:hypothetical protein NC796_19910 [Aliifodinibius sp. S!AR15-10]|uniref:hypothetical protein n=1 Tax=Aliifodinibius sp. S!AR15-10 TaxID=2950437 RepID=UPI002864111F|nr:hypothetical protein [Aliifodinibius sp. S!AR15-10]MDR8393431.1 hypothetical protein [Aliifodinibius sp. S!AR15-10]
MACKKILPALIITFLLLALNGCGQRSSVKIGPLSIDQPVKGWMILSDNEEEGLHVIENAARYDINHLQISHQVIHSLRHVRDKERRELAKTFTDAAHDAGIQEVVFWDHALHELDYYPDRFKTGPDSTLNLDNPDFWTWFKNDYRDLLDMAPDIQGLILTFIETGARAENQYSEKMTTNQQKLAAVVNAVAEVVIEERGLNLYTRTFSYTHEEYDNIVGAIELFKYPEIRLMMKETPHDFFLTHPNDFFAGTIDHPTIMEFDAAGEFNGQGIIANTWPEYILHRWSDFLQRDHVIGYVARTDRYGDTRIIDRPSEINLWALKRYVEDQSLTADDIYREFIVSEYGEDAFPQIKDAFENSYDIVTSVLYTLGTNTANHSRLNYDPYSSHWARHVSGKWLEPPVGKVGHGVDKEFHYWKDIINTLAPAWAKKGGTQLEEIPAVIENNWLDEQENMSEEYLDYVITEKEHGIKLANESLQKIEEAKPVLSEQDFEELHQYFARTLLTARLHRDVAAAYFGFRIYARGEEFRTESLMEKTKSALQQIPKIANQIKNYPHYVQSGQWNWRADAEQAMWYYDKITKEGWPEENDEIPVTFSGITFPLE